MKICAIVLLSHSVTMLCSRQWWRNWLRDICSAIAKANLWFNQQSMSGMQSNRHGPCQRCERQTSRQQNRSTSGEDQKLRGVLWRKTITHGWIMLDRFFETHPEDQDVVIVMLKNMTSLIALRCSWTSATFSAHNACTSSNSTESTKNV